MKTAISTCKPPCLFRKGHLLFSLRRRKHTGFCIRCFLRNCCTNAIWLFLSEKERIEEGIAQYLLLAKKMGAGILNYWQHPVVNLIEYQVKKVSREKHLLLGVLRFQPLEESEILYAPFEPTYRVIYLLGSAFKKRLNHLPFILHDKKRNIACLHWQSELLYQEHFFEQHLSKKYWKYLTEKNLILDARKIG